MRPALGFLPLRSTRYDGANFFAPYVLAILDHHQGRKEQAQAQLAAAEAHKKPERHQAHWRFFLNIDLFRREAQELIGQANN